MGWGATSCSACTTRSGSVDPSILLHLEQHHGLTATELEQGLGRTIRYFKDHISRI